MATKKELQDKIADLKKRSANKSLPASAVTKLNGMIAGLEKDLAKMKDEPEAKPKAKKDSSPKKKVVPKKKAATKNKASKVNPDEKSCDELREAYLKRRAASKNKKEKTPYASSTSAIENAVDSIKKKYNSDELTKNQIEKLIETLLEEVQFLKDLLKKAK